MINFLPAVFSIISCCIVYTVGFAFIPSFKEKKKEYIKRGLIFTFIAAVSALVFGIFISGTTLFEKAPSAYSGAIAGSSCFMGFVVSRFVTHENLKNFLRRIGVFALALFLLEGLVFNFRSFTSDTKNYIVDFTQTQTEDTSGGIIINPENIVFNNDGNVIIPVKSDKIGSMSIEFDTNDNFFKSTVFITDENFSNNPIPVGSKFLSGEYKKPLVFGISGYGEINEIKLDISNSTSPVTINSIKFNTAMPYEFNDTRFYFLIAVCFIIIAIISFKLYRITYDNKSAAHRLLIAALAVLCAYSVAVFNNPVDLPVEYTNELDITYNDPYVQMFDAVMNGRVDIDVQPSEELLALENPYDASARDNVYYLWDRAFFEGKYYSYYGITPVLLFYFPYYWIHGDVPTMNTTCQFFGMLAILFMYGAIMSFVKSFLKKPNMLLLIISLMSSCMMSGIYMAVNYSNQYNVPNVTSTCFLMLCLWCGVSACNRLTEKKSVALFALSGLAFVLCLSSRPSKSLSALILAPLFIGVLLSKKITVKRKLVSVSAFLLPIIAGLCAIMWYNYARFGSPFDFGQTYQLTVSNINANKINFALLPDAIIRYFLQPVDFVGDFPYIGFNGVTICNHGQYVYDAATCGVLSFPVILAGVLIMPMLVWHTRHRNTTPYCYNQNRIRNYTYVLILVISVVVSFMDYCIGGAIIDYNNDILPILMIMSILVLLETQQRSEKFPVIANKLTCVFSVSNVISVIIFAALILSIHEYSIFKHFPAILTDLEKLICFWH